MPAPVLQVERPRPSVALLVLSRPEKKNALSAELRSAIVDTLTDLAADEDVSVVVLTGVGGAFCAVFDLDEVMAAADPLEVFSHATTYHHVVHCFPKPLIAAVEGVAVAGGMDLALMCDLRVCATDARFGQPQVKMGVPVAYELLASIVPTPAARELCLTGRILDAGEAAEMGLANKVVEPGTTLEVALELATEIADVAGAGIMKQSIVAAQPHLFDNERPM